MTPPAATEKVVGRASWTGRSIVDLAIDVLPVGVLIASPEGDRSNAELHRIWRRPPDLPLDRRALARGLEPLNRRSRAGPAPAPPPSRPLTVALGGRDVPTSRYRLRRDDGSTGIVRIIAAPIRDRGSVLGAVLVAADESAQHDMERLRDAFLGILGHELRTPITAIVGGSELLADAGLPPDVRAEVAATLVDEATRLHRIVDQLLRLAALEGRDDVAREPVAIGHVVRRVAARLCERLPQLTVEISVERGLPPISADEGYVEQVVSILLDNAVKHAGAHRGIGARVTRAGDEIEVHLLDNGPGLPVAGREALFRLFHRGPSVGSAAGGTGIGLFVADAIVREMGGRIWAENRPEGGADVGFAFPIDEG